MSSKFQNLLKKKMTETKRSVHRVSDDVAVVEKSATLMPALEVVDDTKLTQSHHQILGNSSVMLPIASIEIREQVRQEFNDIDLLAADIKSRGQRMPVEVEELSSGSYLLLSGERRYRAITQLTQSNPVKWGFIKATIVSDLKTASDKLINQFNENIQRQDLNPIEEAKALKQLMGINQWSAADLAKAIAKHRSYVSRKLSLLDSPESIQQQIIRGELSQDDFLKAKTKKAEVMNVTSGAKKGPDKRETRVPVKINAVTAMCQLLETLANQQGLSPVSLSDKPSRKELLAIIETRLSEVLSTVRNT